MLGVHLAGAVQLILGHIEESLAVVGPCQSPCSILHTHVFINYHLSEALNVGASGDLADPSMVAQPLSPSSTSTCTLCMHLSPIRSAQARASVHARRTLHSEVPAP